MVWSVWGLAGRGGTTVPVSTPPLPRVGGGRHSGAARVVPLWAGLG